MNTHMAIVGPHSCSIKKVTVFTSSVLSILDIGLRSNT